MTPEDRVSGPEPAESGPPARTALGAAPYPGGPAPLGPHPAGPTTQGGGRGAPLAPGLPAPDAAVAAPTGWGQGTLAPAPGAPRTAAGPAASVPAPAGHREAGVEPRRDTAPEDAATGSLYVVGDVHGYLDQLAGALREQGLVDSDGHWAAGRTRLWFLGDFTDRGPDGVGVIDLVMQLAAEAAAAGGYCRALMGNHELLLLGAQRFGDEPVRSSAGTASFLAAWRLNGGQQQDMDRLQEHHLRWLSRLPAVALEDGHLLVHSDTTAYLEYGSSIDEVNDTVHELLSGHDLDAWWDCFRRFTRRFAFRGDAGALAAGELLDAYGGHRVVHGHSPIPYLVGDEPDEDGRAPGQVTGPHVYADDLAVAMDGGVTMEGRLLVARLPLA